MEGVGGRSGTDHLAIDASSAGGGVVESFEDQSSGTLGHHKPVSIDIERSGDPLVRESSHVSEASEGDGLHD